MYATDTEVLIPKYPLAPDLATGSKMFSIVKADGTVNLIRAEFLIPHRKDYYFWAFVKEGSSRHWIDMKPYQLSNNSFHFSTPHQIHLKEEAKAVKGIIVAFTADFLTLEENGLLRQLPIIQNPHNEHELCLNDKDVEFIEDMLEKVYEENRAGGNWGSSMLMGYMRILFIYLSRLYTEQFSPSDLHTDRALLKKYLEKIESAYVNQHEVAAYAAMLNISAGHLSDVVKEQSGKPAIVHIHERIILEAKRLLFHTDDAIKEIAFNLGFDDASYFNRFFKRIVQSTPAAYRTNIRKMYH
jgi:AraC family transcriptional regulator, transcriptional activator of pobA